MAPHRGSPRDGVVRAPPADTSDAAGSSRIDDVTDLLDAILDDTEGESEVSMSTLLGTLDNRSYGPLLLLPGILAVSPVGAIPGMSVVTGLLIVLIASQALWGRAHPWLPSRLLEFSFSRDRMRRGIEKSRLAVIPMAVSLPGSAIVPFALGWTARDGVLVIAAFALAAASVALTLATWS